MRTRFLVLILTAVGGGAALFAAACVGDEPTVAVAPDGGADGTTGDAIGTPDNAVPGVDSGDAGGDSASTACGTPPKNCLGGACVGGVCQPFAISTGLNHPTGIVLSGGVLYFVEEGDPVAGGVACDPSKATGAVSRVDTAGVKTTKILTGKVCPSGHAIDGNTIYFAEVGAGPGQGIIWEVNTDGTNVRQLFTGLTKPSGVHSDTVSLYWLVTAAVNRGPVGGGTADLLAGGQQGAIGLSLDTTNVYWGDNAGLGSIRRASRAAIDAGTDAGVELFATGLPDGGVMNPNGIQVSGTSVFWGDVGNINVPGTGNLFKADALTKQVVLLASGVSPRTIHHEPATNTLYAATLANVVIKLPDTGGNPTPIATDTGGPFVIATDDTAIYWTAYFSGKVMKLAK